MAATITFAPKPFAEGAYKKVYSVVPASHNSTIVFNNVDPAVDKVITRTLVYHSGHNKEVKKQYLANALCELEMQHIFWSVELAPRIYAIQFNSYKKVDNKSVPELFIYYLDGTRTVADVYHQIMENLTMNNDNLVLYVLTQSCAKDDLANLIGDVKPIANYKQLLEHIDTFIMKLVYHEYWFLDFKTSNMCISTNPLNITGLDFDKKFIVNMLDIDKKQYSMDTMRKVARTHMFVLAVLYVITYYAYTNEDADEIRVLVQTCHLKGADISEMFRVLIDLEKGGHNLCRNKYNPLSMLTYYTLTTSGISAKDVLSCNNIDAPMNTIFETIATDKKVHEYVKTIAINNVFGLAEYNAEKKGVNYLTNRFISADFDSYAARIAPLAVRPQIPYEPEIIISPMFMNIPATTPSISSVPSKASPQTKKYKPTEGGRKKRKQRHSKKYLKKYHR